MLCIVVNSENLDFNIKIMLALDHDSYIKTQVIRLYIHTCTVIRIYLYIKILRVYMYK